MTTTLISTIESIFDVSKKIDNKQSLELKLLVIEKIQSQTETIVKEYVDHKIDLTKESNISLTSTLLNAVFFLRELSIERKEKIFFHPSYNYLLKGLKRYSIEPNMSEKQIYFLSSIIDFIWCEMLYAGKLNTQIKLLTDYKGGIRCPAFNRYIELGEKYIDSKIELSVSDDQVKILCDDGLLIYCPTQDIFGQVELPLPIINENGYEINKPLLIFDDQVEFWARDPWLRAKFSGTNQRNDGIIFWGVDNEVYPSEPDPNPYIKTSELLKTFWKEQYEDFILFTKVIIPMDSGPYVRRGFTVSSRQGAIYIDIVDPEDMAENIVHENAHVKLRYLQMLDDILINPLDDEKKFPVAWRTDPRPIPGILEGLYVFTHIAEYLYRRNNHKKNDLPILLRNIKNAEMILKENAEFTELGKIFFDSMQEWIKDLSTKIESA